MIAATGPSPNRLRVLLFERTDPRDESIAWLRNQGCDVQSGRADADPSFKSYTEAEIIAEAQGFDAVLGSSGARFPRAVIEALPRLRYISKLGIGVDTIDIAAASEHGILVSNTPESAGVMAVAEHAIAIMLAVCKRLTVWTPEFFRRGGWRDATFAGMLEGSTIGIIGFGRIGRAVAQRLAGWGVHILAYDPFPGPAMAGVAMVSLPELLARADVVTLHCGATAENRHLIDGAALAQMKATAVLVNTGRGSLVDSAALLAALKTNRIAGAALDVFETEPPDPNDGLFTLGNVIVTPHAATRTARVFLDRRWQAARNLWAMLNNAPCDDVVNPEARALREKQG
jgi:D-3-phosphoglycerate dehydrogenase